MDRIRNDNVKRMNLNEFVADGYLQEVNRRFFHPLGLALEVIMEKDGTVASLGGIWDYRNDPEGMLFPDLNTDHAFLKEERITSLQNAKNVNRIKKYGFVIQPIGHTLTEKEPPKDPFTCPRRYETPVFNEVDEDYWVLSKDGQYRTCSFCGCLHPDEFMQIVKNAKDEKEGFLIDYTTKNYKFYAHAPNTGQMKFYTMHLKGRDTEWMDELESILYDAITKSAVKFQERKNQLFQSLEERNRGL